jgi:hypothetical protein
MSAGDVKFIGWQGTNPSYQELEPSISYQPFREFTKSTFRSNESIEIGQYVRAKVTRTVIVFSKDKDTFINGLEFLYNTLNLTYVDTNGSIGTKAYGSGWELTTIDESPIAKGYTQIRLSYEKVIAKSLAFFGVDGLSVDCVAGVCRIRYKNNNIETIDSGAGECTTGLQFIIESLTPPELSEDLFDPIVAAKLNDATFYRVQMVCNGVLADTVEIVGNDLPKETIEKVVLGITFTATIPKAFAPNTLFVRWTKQGNIVRLVFGGTSGFRTGFVSLSKTIREYDVTGL